MTDVNSNATLFTARRLIDKNTSFFRFHPFYLNRPLQGKIVAQGRLLLQDTFMVSDPEGSLLGRMKERRVFLFEQVVIFSELLDKKKGFSAPGFLYKNSIKVSEVLH